MPSRKGRKSLQTNAQRASVLTIIEFSSQSSLSHTFFNCSNMSKNAQAERKAKARFHALLRRRCFSREPQKRRYRFSRVTSKNAGTQGQNLHPGFAAPPIFEA